MNTCPLHCPTPFSTGLSCQMLEFMHCYHRDSIASVSGSYITFHPCSSRLYALSQVHVLQIAQEAVEISSQQDLERKLIGLQNEVQVLIHFLSSKMFLSPTKVGRKTISQLIRQFRYSGSLCCSASNMQCHVWRSSKMSLISNTKPSRWKVGICSFTLISEQCFPKMTNEMTCRLCLCPVSYRNSGSTLETLCSRDG